jgi:hypothetical protein
MSKVEILTKKDAISVLKENGTQVDYYIFDEFEIHQCKISPHSIQEWHKHEKIEEVIVVTQGDICVKWKEDNAIKAETVSKGFILRVKDSIHTIENRTECYAEFNVFRMVPVGEVKREVIKNDKIMISESQL